MIIQEIKIRRVCKVGRVVDLTRSSKAEVSSICAVCCRISPKDRNLRFSSRISSIPCLSILECFPDIERVLFFKQGRYDLLGKCIIVLVAQASDICSPKPIVTCVRLWTRRGQFYLTYIYMNVHTRICILLGIDQIASDLNVLILLNREVLGAVMAPYV